MKSTAVVGELARIAKENDGLLLPETVVEEAKPKSSPLHSRFDWNDNEAAHKYRLWQARQLITIFVDVIPGVKEPVQRFISLSSDRKEGGYRVMVDVLSDADMRTRLLKDALDELDSIRLKYQHLKELCSVWRTVWKVKRKRK